MSDEERVDCVGDYVDKCINACRGLADPEAAIGRLVEAARRVIVRAMRRPHDSGYTLDDADLNRLEDAAAPFLAARKGSSDG